MKKISDRFLLGVISGLCGNISKHLVENFFNRIGFSKGNGIQTASGIFLKKSDISTPYGKAVGSIADNMIAAGLGITCIYWLTLMGKDKAFIKGAGLGAAEWTALYGIMSKFGAAAIYPVPPKDALATFLSHVAFGVTKIYVAINLGDERLFNLNNLPEKIETPKDLLPKNSNNT